MTSYLTNNTWHQHGRSFNNDIDFGNSQLLVSTRKVLSVVLLQVIEGVYHVFEPVHIVAIDVPVPQVAVAGVLSVTHLKIDKIINSSWTFYSIEISECVLDGWGGDVSSRKHPLPPILSNTHSVMTLLPATTGNGSSIMNWKTSSVSVFNIFYWSIQTHNKSCSHLFGHYGPIDIFAEQYLVARLSPDSKVSSCSSGTSSTSGRLVFVWKKFSLLIINGFWGNLI